VAVVRNELEGNQEDKIQIKERERFSACEKVQLKRKMEQVEASQQKSKSGSRTFRSYPMAN
jgi:hypothetical protein